MSVTVEWTFRLRTTTSDKALKVLRRAIKQISRDATIIGEPERYWKDTSLYIGKVKLTLDTDDEPTAIYQTIRINGELAKPWLIGGIQHFGDGTWEFHGGTDHKAMIGVVGVASIDFMLGNFQ